MKNSFVSLISYSFSVLGEFTTFLFFIGCFATFFNLCTSNRKKHLIFLSFIVLALAVYKINNLVL